MQSTMLQLAPVSCMRGLHQQAASVWILSVTIGVAMLTISVCDCNTDGEHQHEMQCTLQGVPAVQPVRSVKTMHTASHLEQKLSLHPTGPDTKPLPRNTAFAASHLEARETLHPL